MKRIGVFCLTLILLCNIGSTPLEGEKIFFTTDVPFNKGTVKMSFHITCDWGCATGTQEYYTPCIPAETEGEFTIPDSITVPDGRVLPINWISRGSFQSCPKLTQINIPKTVKYISDLAFQGCTSLREITLPDSIKTIYPQAFIGCSSLRRVHFCYYQPPRCYNDDTFDETTYATATLVVPVETAEYYLSNPLTHRFRYHAEVLPIYNNE